MYLLKFLYSNQCLRLDLMGTYLATGIVQEISIDKRRIKYPEITVDKITDKLKDELNLDCYDYSEDLERILLEN